MSSSTNPRTPHPEMVIAGRYRLDEHWAHGGMADVWRATDLQLSRTVAVKLLKPHLANESNVAERFRREAVAAANLNHYNIVTVHDAIEDDGRQAVIMEFVDGKSLRELLDDGRQLPTGLTIHIGVSVCSALEAAHKQGLIHRDVKPANILLLPSGRVMLTDFGIAKALGSNEDLTSENVMMGTAKYLSPEQVSGDELDARADTYSLGLVLYECLAGKVPFLGKNDTETALARLQKDPTSIVSICPDVDPAVAVVIHKMISRSPKHRYSSAALTRQALKKADESRSAKTPTENGRPHADRTPTPGKVIRPKEHTPTGSGRPLETNDKNGARDPLAGAPPHAPWRPTPILLIGAAIALLVLGVIIASAVGKNKNPNPQTNPLETVIAETLPYNGPVEIMGIKSYDPEGDDKTENEAEVAKVTDGDPATFWSTSCYQSLSFGSKSGVGLVLQLNAQALAQLTVDMGRNAWKAAVYTAQTEAATIGEWGSPIWKGTSDAAQSITATFKNPAQYVLIFFTEAGKSGFCSNKNPYRIDVSEVRISPAP